MKPGFVPLRFRELPEDEMRARARAFYEEMDRRRTVRDFSDRPRFTITVLRSRTEGLCGSLNEATGGRIELLSEPHDGR